MKYWENGVLQVSENGKYLTNGEQPFFWLGDTAWLMLQQCSLEETKIYLKNRKEKGFNVIQSTLIHRMPGEGTSSLATVKKDIMTEEYWLHCDKVIKMAEELGLYMGLLPTWGSIVKAKILTADNVERYANFLGERYGHCSNIIWILGGDIRGSDGLDVYPKFGRRLKELMPDKLIAYHPFGRTASSQWFHHEDWLDINMFQSGHRRYNQASLGEWDDNAHKEEFFGEDSWRYVERDYTYQPAKPTLDGEPSYEQIPQGLHDPSQPYWQACDVRRYAYWSVFQGAAGHTYGNNAVQQCYIGDGNGNYGVKEVWQDAIHHEGAGHLQHLKNLMLSVDYINGRAAEELLLSGQKEKYERIAIFAGHNFIFCYDYMGCEFTLDISAYRGVSLDAYWFEPVSGVYSYLQEVTGLDKLTVKPVAKYVGQNDWVLVIKSCEI
jgi:hypothetical protein